MAHLPVIPDTFRVALLWTDGLGGSAANVIHIRTSGSGKTAAAVFACMDAHVTATVWDLAANSVGITEVQVTPLDGSSATFSGFTSGVAKWSGNGAGTPIPAQAAIVKLLTGLRGRSFRGRVFIPFVGEGDTANGILDNVKVAAMQSAWSAWDGAMAGDGTTPQKLVVASYKLALATDVTAFNAEVVAATQRRRQSRLR